MFTPDNMPEIKVSHSYWPDEPQTFDDPGCPAEVELHEIKINGHAVSPDLETFLFESFGDQWERAIIWEQQTSRQVARRKLLQGDPEECLV